MRSFDHVLRIDTERRTAEVEGMITYQTLADETLRYGLLPAVVPQLKTITLGGAVSGLGIESSSFKYGLVHETVEAMEVLTGTEDIVACSACRNPDLFLDFLTLTALSGTPCVLPSVWFPCSHTSTLRTPGSRLRTISSASRRQLCEQASDDFLDATIFGRGVYITQAAFCDRAPQVSDYTYMDIYYRSIQRKQSDWLTARDYIWRWDTDWFWCSKHFGVQHPAIRLFAGPALNSRTYQRVMRLSQELLPASTSVESVIQDVDVPMARAAEFCEFLLREIGISPVWVCPFRNSERRYDLCPLPANRFYVNFGFWDMVPTTREAGYYNRMIERKIVELGGAEGALFRVLLRQANVLEYLR